MTPGPHHKDGCDGTNYRVSGDGYNRVKVCECGAEDHYPTRESIAKLFEVSREFLNKLKEEENDNN